MPDPGTGWKNQPQQLLDWALIGLAGVVVPLSRHLGLTTEDLSAFGLVIEFGGWLGPHRTDYWSSGPLWAWPDSLY